MPHPLPMAWAAVYLAAGALSWYFCSALSYGLNGGQLGRHPLLFPFQCLAEELPCYLPLGRRHRVRFIQERVEGWSDGVMCSETGSLTYREIRAGSRYEEAFWMMMPGRFGFWAGHLVPFGIGMLLLLGAFDVLRYLRQMV